MATDTPTHDHDRPASPPPSSSPAPCVIYKQTTQEPQQHSDICAHSLPKTKGVCWFLVHKISYCILLVITPSSSSRHPPHLKNLKYLRWCSRVFIKKLPIIIQQSGSSLKARDGTFTTREHSIKPSINYTDYSLSLHPHPWALYPQGFNWHNLISCLVTSCQLVKSLTVEGLAPGVSHTVCLCYTSGTIM